MAPRKAELLDLMRKQRAAEQESSAERTESSPKQTAPVEKPKPAPRAAAEPSGVTPPVRFSSPRVGKAGRAARLPWTGIGLVLLIAIPMVYWLSGVFGAGEIEAGDQPSAAEETAAAAEPATAARSFRVVAIQYDRTPSNATQAVEVGNDLLKLLGTRDGEVYEFENWIRIYLGLSDSADGAVLAELRARLRELEYPAGSGQKPFRTAYIAPFPPTSR